MATDSACSRLLNAATTTYVWGANGKRWKWIVDDGSTVTANLYVMPELEIENPAAGAQSDELVHWYLHPNIRHVLTRTNTEIHAMHRDQLNSVVMMTDDTADWGIERVYAPFGADKNRPFNPKPPPSPS